MRWLFAALLVVVVFTVGCTTRQAQITVQTALTAAMQTTVSASDEVSREVPAAYERAGDEVEAACADGTCTNPGEMFMVNIRPWLAAVTGFRHAVDTLYLFQDGVDLWIDTGTLPDLEPLCADVENVFGDLLTLLTDVGLDPPEALATVQPNVSTVCSVIGRFIQGQQNAGGE